MDESKTGKYIITELKPNFRQAPSDRSPEDIAKAEKSHLQLLFLDDTVIKGAFYMECVWIWPGTEYYPTVAEPNAHAHDFDEVWIFTGTDRKNPRDLGGELDFWLEDEHYVIDKSCIVYLPRGLKHGPCGIRRIDRPIFFVTAGNGTTYTRSSGQEY